MTKIAMLISRVFDPMPTIFVVGLFGILATPMGELERQRWLILMVAMVITIAAIMVWFLRRGYVFDARLSAGDDLHRDRLGILWAVNAFLLLAVVIAWFSGRLEPLWSILVSMTVLMIVATIITGYYKVSLHMLGVTSLTVVLLFQLGLKACPLLILVPLVAWSRRVLRRHTRSQLIIGMVTPLVVFMTIYTLTGQLDVHW